MKRNALTYSGCTCRSRVSDTGAPEKSARLAAQLNRPSTVSYLILWLRVLTERTDRRTYSDERQAGGTLSPISPHRESDNHADSTEKKPERASHGAASFSPAHHGSNHHPDHIKKKGFEEEAGDDQRRRVNLLHPKEYRN